MQTQLFPLALLLLLPLATRADDPVFTARTTAGKEYRGPLARLDTDWSLEVGKGARRKIPAGDLLELRQAAVPLPALPAGDHLILANGDRVPFTALKLDDEKLLIRHPDLGADDVAIPVSSVLVIWRIGPERVIAPEKLRRSLHIGKRSRDVVFLRNGDRIEGTVNAVGQLVKVEVNKKIVQAKWTQVSAIAFSTDLADKPKAPALAGRIVLTATERSPGGRLTITAPSLIEDELRAKTSFGAILRVPVERIASLEPIGGKSVDLSSLKPTRYEYRPYLDERWPFAIDATVTRRHLRVGGSVYQRGVGVHASSILTYSLDGKYERFEALVGLDDTDGRRGRVRIRVLIDGKGADIGQKGEWTHKGGPWRISLNVEKAKTLTLETLAGENGPVEAVVNWVEARLVK